MIRINSFLHREELADVIRRWMYDEASPSDAALLTGLAHFNHLYVSRYLARFSGTIFTGLHGEGLSHRPVRVKGELKEALIKEPPYHNKRIDALLQEYRENPGRFYRETPFHGTLFFLARDGRLEYLGSNRIKRVRRLAEKSARRVIDRIFTRIKHHADDLAEQRAQQLGIPREVLLTTPNEMIEEFLKAENRLLLDLQEKRPIEREGDEPLVINDVAGMKVILEEAEQWRLPEVIAMLPDCEIIERERHSGRYNATNFIIRYRPPREEILKPPLGKELLALMQARGYAPEEAAEAFAAFVRSGEEDVLLEIILSTYQESLESEIGRSIHEDRILEQRLYQPYRGPLARNIQCLMEYLFTFPISNQRDLGELPIKLWNRYLPDYFDEILKKLFHVPPIPWG